MEIITGDRGTGKTTELLKRAAETDAYIICTTMHRCGDLFEMAHRLGIKIKYPLSVNECINGGLHSRYINGEIVGQPVVIDDLEDVLRECMVGWKSEIVAVDVDTATITNMNKD